MNTAKLGKVFANYGVESSPEFQSLIVTSPYTSKSGLQRVAMVRVDVTTSNNATFACAVQVII